MRLFKVFSQDLELSCRGVFILTIAVRSAGQVAPPSLLSFLLNWLALLFLSINLFRIDVSSLIDWLQDSNESLINASATAQVDNVDRTQFEYLALLFHSYKGLRGYFDFDRFILSKYKTDTFALILSADLLDPLSNVFNLLTSTVSVNEDDIHVNVVRWGTERFKRWLCTIYCAIYTELCHSTIDFLLFVVVDILIYVLFSELSLQKVIATLLVTNKHHFDLIAQLIELLRPDDICGWYNIKLLYSELLLTLFKRIYIVLKWDQV